MSDRFRTQEDVFRFLDIVESKGVGNLIPFPDDLLFHFFNKDTIITDTYIQDAKTLLKLYPKQSGAVRATAVNSCIPVSKTILANTKKINSVFKHKLSELNNFGYIWAGANASSPYATTGLYLTSGKLAYSFYWFGSTPGACAINTSALEDGNYYLCRQTVGETNISMKMNKLTNVNNAIVIGSDINSTTTAKGTEELTGSCFGILSACYSNGSYNYASGNQMVYIEFLDENDNVLLRFNFSEGYGEQVFDIVSGNAYPISNITVADFWNYTQDFNHYNFRYGFTLYKKSGSPDIRTPNKKDGTEIIPPSIPSGYARVANYKECRETFNQCESVFKLDNVAEVSRDVLAVCPDSFYNGLYVRQNDELYICTANNSEISISGGTWRFRNRTTYAIPYTINRVWPWQTNPALEDWSVVGVTCSNPVVFSNQDLYDADVDHILFTANTGAAKQIEIQDIYSNIVDLTLDMGHLYISSDSDKNLMLYKTDKGVDTPEDLKIWAYVEK